MVFHIFPAIPMLVMSRIVRCITMSLMSLLMPLLVSLHRLVMLLLTGFLMLSAALLSGVSMVLPSPNPRLPVMFHDSIPLLVAVLMSFGDTLPGIFSMFGFQAIVSLSSRFRRPAVPTGIHPTMAL